MREALTDICRRLCLELTGAIQHAMEALESTIGSVTGESEITLGKLIDQLDLPYGRIVVHNLSGFASEQARHIQG